MDRVLAKAVNGEITMKAIDLCRRSEQKRIVRGMLGREMHIHRSSGTIGQVQIDYVPATVYIHGDARDYSRTLINNERELGVYLTVQKVVSENDVEWSDF